MFLRKAGRFVIVKPETTDEALLIEQKIVTLLKAGYQVEMRRWGSLVITDPALKFKWESIDMMVDVKKILGLLL